jgi:predicted nucleotidyltransferase component of viral defense system
MQLKALVNNKAKALRVPSQLVMQNYVLERLLERIASSRYKDRFVIKGGFLLSSVIGLDTRTTKDLDTTVRAMAVQEESLRKVFSEIIAIPADDDLTFKLGTIEEIREGDEYPGLRVSLTARYEQLAVPLSVDVTAGDSIAPPPITRSFSRMFDDGTFEALSYPLEVVAAEKLETILSRLTANTRARDYYDVCALDHTDGHSLDGGLLHEALTSTTAHRNTAKILKGVAGSVTVIAADGGLSRLWDAYARKNSFAKDISFVDTCASIENLMRRAGF